MIRRVALVVIGAVTLSAVLPGLASAAPGDLDTTFDGDGVALTAFASRAETSGVAIQADGKIVAVGYTGAFHAGVFDLKFAVARYNPDGSPDDTFSVDGKIVTNITPWVDSASDVAIQTDGKIVVAGRAGGAGGRFAVVRYETDGALDTSYAGDGILVTNLTPGDDFASAVALQSDGKIVAAGVVEMSRLNSRFAVVRYNVDGTLDETFSVDGKVATNLTAESDFALGLVIQADGKIVAAGRAGGSGGRFALVRYETNGARDLTFGSLGKVLTNFSHGNDFATDVTVQPDTKIVAAGTGGTFPAGAFTLARYAADGSLDDTFGGDGRVREDVTGALDAAEALAIQSDGKILVAGIGVSTGSCCESFTVLSRFGTTGLLDDSFGVDGTVMTEFTVSQGASDIALQSDGRIVLATTVGYFSFKSTFAILRYLDN